MVVKGNFRDEGDSGSTNLTEFLLKVSQDDQTSPGEWWRWENWLDIKGNQIPRVRVLVKLDSAESKVQKSSLIEKVQRDWVESLVSERIFVSRQMEKWVKQNGVPWVTQLWNTSCLLPLIDGRVLDPWFSIGVILLLRGHLAISGNNFGCNATGLS